MVKLVSLLLCCVHTRVKGLQLGGYLYEARMDMKGLMHACGAAMLLVLDTPLTDKKKKNSKRSLHFTPLTYFITYLTLHL